MKIRYSLQSADEARIRELEEALRPFADVAEHDIGESEADEDQFAPMAAFNRAPKLSVGDLRHAHVVLTKK